jgi:NET1-associated nuclear protein 1 (U3 small nucleolar RNA-associated protein 17)
MNTLCQTLTSPECKVTTSAQFVGKGGRYLVVFGDHDLVLWDVVALCGTSKLYHQ